MKAVTRYGYETSRTCISLEKRVNDILVDWHNVICFFFFFDAFNNDISLIYIYQIIAICLLFEQTNIRT